MTFVYRRLFCGERLIGTGKRMRPRSQDAEAAIRPAQLARLVFKPLRMVGRAREPSKVAHIRMEPSACCVAWRPRAQLQIGDMVQLKTNHHPWCSVSITPTRPTCAT
jgi:hypothetical protein